MKKNKIIKVNLIIYLFFILIINIISADSPPQPHNVRGRVFNLDGVTGVDNDIPVTINNTVSGDFILTYTYAPDIPSLKGSYSTTIDGTDNDTIIVIAWNSTYYGTNTTNLSSTTTYADIVLNTTRPSETNVTIITPSNNSVKNTSYPFNVTANITIIGGKDGVNCNAAISFSDNSILNISHEESFIHNLGDISLDSSKITVWNVTVISEGFSNISVQAECADQTRNFENVNIDYVYNITTIDTSSPIINLISPTNNSLVRRNITFFYDVSDHSYISNCSLVVNGAVRANDTSVEKGTTQNFTLFLDFGNYNYYINCSDDSSNYNVGSSETRLFNVSDMDLTLSSSDITFSNENPVENERITINATLYNIGEENITESFIVQFFEGDPESDGVQIGEDTTINELNSSSNKTINISWTAKQGTYNIYAIVDAPLATYGSVNEVNESNNKANNTIFIPAYHIYYGKIGANIALDSASNHSVFMWFNETEISGNVFFIDSDSPITWTNLTALGINISGKNASNDFEEADDALDITGFTDSINAAFADNGYAKNPDSFLVYSKNITNVPIDNSTDNSNFITGILWDSSDSNPSEYDGTQDLVFITKINNNAQGKYGIYDYEIKIPANLRRYVIPNEDNSVTLYTELR